MIVSLAVVLAQANYILSHFSTGFIFSLKIPQLQVSRFKILVGKKMFADLAQAYVLIQQ